MKGKLKRKRYKWNHPKFSQIYNFTYFECKNLCIFSLYSFCLYTFTVKSSVIAPNVFPESCEMVLCLSKYRCGVPIHISLRWSIRWSMRLPKAQNFWVKMKILNRESLDLRRGHVSYFSCHSISISLSHSAFAMFIL